MMPDFRQLGHMHTVWRLPTRYPLIGRGMWWVWVECHTGNGKKQKWIPYNATI